MPHVTALHCAGCRVMGGTTVRTRLAADGLTQLLGRTVKVGQYVRAEQPCGTSRAELREIRRVLHRRCPRVELPQSLVDEARIVFLSLQDPGRLSALMLTIPPRRRRRAWDRASAVLEDQRVLNAWRWRQDAAADARKPREA
jgi:hypothetical protein